MQKEQEDYEELFKEAVKQEPMRLPKTENQLKKDAELLHTQALSTNQNKQQVKSHKTGIGMMLATDRNSVSQNLSLNYLDKKA